MTPLQLRTILENLLGPYLGTFKRPGRSSIPAIWVGEPDSKWVASGLEVRIPFVPTIEQTPAHQRGIITEEYTVRLVSHGAPANQRAAVRAILSRWPDATATEVPANEAVGILAQHTITIPV